MFGGNDHESWGYEPFTALASMQRRESRNFFSEAARDSIDEQREAGPSTPTAAGGVSSHSPVCMLPCPLSCMAKNTCSMVSHSMLHSKVPELRPGTAGIM